MSEVAPDRLAAELTPRSLLDDVDLTALRATALGLPGAWATAVACLGEGGALTWDALDPAWADRDRLVVGAQAALPAVRAAFGLDASGAFQPQPVADALAVAVEQATASGAAGDPYRVLCLLGAGAARNGAVWEAAVTAAERRLGALVLIVLEAPIRNTEAMLQAAGWSTLRARSDDPVAVLGALDRAYGRTGAPRGVLLRGG